MVSFVGGCDLKYQNKREYKNFRLSVYYLYSTYLCLVSCVCSIMGPAKTNEKSQNILCWHTVLIVLQWGKRVNKSGTTLKYIVLVLCSIVLLENWKYPSPRSKSQNARIAQVQNHLCTPWRKSARDEKTRRHHITSHHIYSMHGMSCLSPFFSFSFCSL